MLLEPWGDIAYTFLIIIGVAAAVAIVYFYLRKKGATRSELLDFLLVCVGTLLAGFICAFLFQIIYDVIKEGSSYKFTFKMTFYGGLIGGVITFILLYVFVYLKHHKNNFKEIVTIAPGSVALGHGFGRIGCFLAGCCYGKPTDSWIGVVFPALNDGIKRIPTNLIEAIFLILFGTVLIILAFKTDFKYTAIVYLFGYTIFRFVIEFYRGDDRGGAVGASLSPSQIVCIVLFALTIPIIFILKNLVFKEKIDAKN